MTGRGEPPAELHLHLFGRFRAERWGEVIQLATRHERLLLAWLALHSEPHAREKLAALLWPDASDAAGRASLRNTLSSLRRHLGRDSFTSDRETVQLSPDFPIRADAAEFRREAAKFLQAPSPDPAAVPLDLYTDDLLIDLYDDWVLSERETLRRLYLESLLEMIRQMRSQSRYEIAIGLAGRLLERDRANESAHQHLMFCQLAAGNRAAALKQYESCRSALRDELGVEPSSATRNLFDWIRQDPLEKLPIEASITNLPIPLTRFIGRQRELESARNRVGSARLLTLTGPGGSGKSRLAIHLATGLLTSYRDGVWWVELAALTDAELLPRTVAKALGVPEIPHQTDLETLVGFLRSRQLLLVLDNCEHMLVHSARVVERLLGDCPEVHVLATSREKLSVAGEQVLPVPPLAVPDPEQHLAAASLMEYEAVELFVERARAASAGFSLNDEQSQSVARICARLDGLPLAIELAAARVSLLPPAQIASRLDDAFRLLTGGSRTLPRHQTLRAAIEWGVDLLSEKERVLLRRLSVFAGGWTLPAAEEVCCGDGLEQNEILDLLSRLVDKSLVDARTRGDEIRFHFLQTILQYADDRLLESGEAARLRRRHLSYFLRLVESGNPHLGYMLADEPLEAWLGRLEPEQENLRVAVNRVLQLEDAAENEQHGVVEAALRLLGLLHAFWFARGRFTEGRAWLSRLIERGAGASPATRAQALLTSGFLACWQGDFAAAGQPLRESVDLFRAAGNESGAALATTGIGFAALGEGDASRARSLFEQSHETARGAGDPWITAFARHFLAIVLTFQGELDLAAAHLEEGNEILRQLGGHRQGRAFSLFHLGRIARLKGDGSTAWARHREGMQLFDEIGDRRGIGYSLAGLAAVAAFEGEIERAARLAGAVESLEAVLGRFLEAPLQYEYDHELDEVRSALGRERFSTLSAEGRAMKMREAVRYALE
jgi:predicted ATPase/DNA-binding SARP family transcriptional activator